MFTAARFKGDWHVIDQQGRTVRRFLGVSKEHGRVKGGNVRAAKRNAHIYAALLNAVAARVVQSRDGHYAVWDQPDEKIVQ